MARKKAFEALQGPVLLGLALFIYLGSFQDYTEISRAGLHDAADGSKLGGGYLHAVSLVFEHHQE